LVNRISVALAGGLLALIALSAAAQPQNKIWLSWVPKPVKLPGYAGVNKPVTRLAQVIASHKGQPSWTQEVIQTERYDARWIQMAPGEKTRTQFYGDDRTLWVVWGGQIRFTIQGQAPFIATKGFLVQVPLRVPYSMETVGDAPSLRFEITRGGHILPSYPVDSRSDFGKPPPPRDGQHYVKVSYPTKPVGGGMGTYDETNKPYIDFFHDVVAKYPSGVQHVQFVGDHDNYAPINRGPGVPTPPDTNLGHFHIGNDEFWFILEGKCDYLIEKVGLLTADAGDIVFVPPGRWHRASWALGKSGEAQMDTRMGVLRSPTMQHNYGPDANGTQ
jgi:mannose-6-phosphate isomerase-like protein (cupin superfamily)